MATLCVLGPNQNYMTCEMFENINKVLAMYHKSEVRAINKIITTDETGAAAQARHFADKNCLKLKVYKRSAYYTRKDLYKQMIKKSNFLIIFTYYNESRIVVQAAQYAANHNVNTQVIELIF